MNQMTLMGRLGADGVLKYTANGKAILELSVAVNRKRGEEQHTSWFRVVLFGDQAVRYAPSCRKGSEVFASGEYERRPYQTKEGEKRTAESLLASWFRICAPSPAGDENVGL